jgi:hypothetical protein
MARAILSKSLLLWCILLAACTIQLAPNYDPSLVDGLNQTNTATLTLFATLESGSDKSSFPQFEQRYAEAIGATEALRQRAAGRAVPPLAARLSKLKIVHEVCSSGDDPAACVNTSPASLGRVLEDLRKLRDTHRTKGLASDTVDLIQRDYNTAMGQALAVENALKR